MAVLQGLNDPSTVSTQGQEVAQATGVSYQDIGKPDSAPTQPDYDAARVTQTLAEQDVTPASGLDYVSDKSTVSGQLTSLLDRESPYIQQARLSGERQAARRGMLNTALAAGMSQREAITAALPIAQQDAQAFAQAQGRQQAGDIALIQTQTEGIVSGEMTKQKAAIEQRAQDIQNQFQAQMQGASETNRVLFQDMQNQYNTFNNEMQNAQQILLQNQQITAEKSQSIRTQSSAIMQNYQISVENLMTDPDFLDLGPAAMNNAINQMQTLAKNSIGFLGASSGIDMDPFIDAYLADLEVVT